MVKKTLRKNTQKFQLSGGSNVWNDLLKLSIVPSMNKKIGGNKKTIKNIIQPIGVNNLNNELEGGFIRGGSTQFFPVNCTRVENNYNVNSEVKSGGSREKKNLIGAGLTKEQRSEIDGISRYIMASGDKIHLKLGGITNVANNIFKEYIRGVLNASGIISVKVDDINQQLINTNGFELEIENVFGQEGDFETLKQFRVFRYVIEKSLEGIDVTEKKNTEK